LIRNLQLPLKAALKIEKIPIHNVLRFFFSAKLRRRTSSQNVLILHRFAENIMIWNESAVSAKSYTSGSTLQRDEVYGTLRAALLSAVALGAKGKSVATIDSFEESALAHATPAIEICV
jgi:hypothetical protein